jgi:hypothetical protein
MNLYQPTTLQNIFVILQARIIGQTELNASGHFQPATFLPQSISCFSPDFGLKQALNT